MSTIASVKKLVCHQFFKVKIHCYLQRTRPSDYMTLTPCIHYYFRDNTHRSHHGFIKRVRQTPSLLIISPFSLFLHWRSPLPFCLLFLFPSFSISWAMLAVSISFSNVDFIGCHVFDIRSGDIFARSVFSVLFPFCWQYFLSFILSFGCICFQCFPGYYFSAAAPGISVLKGSLIPCRITGA